MLEINRNQEMNVIKNDQDAVLDMWQKKKEAILRRSCLCMGSKPHAHLAEGSASAKTFAREYDKARKS